MATRKKSAPKTTAKKTTKGATPATSATGAPLRLVGSVMLDQSFQFMAQVEHDAPLRWHPDEAGVFHYVDGSSEPVTMGRTKKPKSIAAGTPFFVSADRAADPDPHPAFHRLVFQNAGHAVEIWDEDVVARLRKAKKWPPR